MSSVRKTITELAHSLHDAGLINDKTLLELTQEMADSLHKTGLVETKTKRKSDSLDLPTAQKSGYIKAN